MGAAAGQKLQHSSAFFAESKKIVPSAAASEARHGVVVDCCSVLVCTAVELSLLFPAPPALVLPGVQEHGDALLPCATYSLRVGILRCFLVNVSTCVVTSSSLAVTTTMLLIIRLSQNQTCCIGDSASSSHGMSSTLEY